MGGIQGYICWRLSVEEAHCREAHFHYSLNLNDNNKTNGRKQGLGPQVQTTQKNNNGTTKALRDEDNAWTRVCVGTLAGGGVYLEWPTILEREGNERESKNAMVDQREYCNKRKARKKLHCRLDLETKGGVVAKVEERKMCGWSSKRVGEGIITQRCKGFRSVHASPTPPGK